MDKKNKIPDGKDFRWTPIREVNSPADISFYFSLLRGSKSREYTVKYGDVIKRDYDNNPNLNVLNCNNGVVTGSNIFADVLVNRIAEKDALRVANESDLEQIYFHHAMNLKPIYAMTGLMLVSEDRPNRRLAQKLSHELRKRFHMKLEELPGPVFIPASHLKTIKYDSQYGLAFKFSEEATQPEPITSLKRKSLLKRMSDLLLGKNTSFMSRSINGTNGFPSEMHVDDGDRDLYLPRSGLTAVRFDDGLIFADVEDLAESDENGRIIIVKDLNQKRKIAKEPYICDSHSGYSG